MNLQMLLFLNPMEMVSYTYIHIAVEKYDSLCFTSPIDLRHSDLTLTDEVTHVDGSKCSYENYSAINC